MLMLLVAVSAGRAQGQEVKSAGEEKKVSTIDQAKLLEGTISKVTGKSVQVSLDGSDKWQPAAVGMKVVKQSLIRTGFASSCEVSFGDHTKVSVQALSSMKVADYSGTSQEEKVRANVQYGAVRCGVEKGAIKVDTRISTPVSTLSIRGTSIYVEFDRGTRRCLMDVIEDGPALAAANSRGRSRGTGEDCVDCDEDEDQADSTDEERHFTGSYELDEGMRTDCGLGRYLRAEILVRGIWNNNDALVAEEESMIYQTGNINPGEGAGQYDDYKSQATQRVIVNGCGPEVPF